jgi:hypothetical protein
MAIQNGEFAPIDWTAIYRVSTRKRQASARLIEFLIGHCGEIPLGYGDFIDRFGIGYLDDIQFLDQKEILSALEVHPGLSWESTKWVGAGGNLRLLACCEVSAHIGKRASEWFGCR